MKYIIVICESDIYDFFGGCIIIKELNVIISCLKFCKVFGNDLIINEYIVYGGKLFV